jgi:hypothetical protein
VSCSNRHKGSVNQPYLGDTWHLSCGSTSPGMTSVSHVSPRHTVSSLLSNLMVDICPHRSIDPRFPLLCGSGLQSLPTPHIMNPPKSQVSGLSDLVPRVLYLSTMEIHFVVHDFKEFSHLENSWPSSSGVPSLWTIGSLAT